MAGRGATLALATVLLWLGLHSPSQAQQPGTVTGVVLDAATGAPVGGALVSVGERGPRAIASARGRFALSGVLPGTYTVRVERFGYTDLEARVTVTDPPAPLELRMRADPVALEGLTVTGGARAALIGSVVDARSGLPVPWTDLTLTRDAVREDRRDSTDENGVFSLPDVPPGAYLLRVERLGYQSQYVEVRHAPPPEPVEVHLEPDSALMAGVGVMTGELRLRRMSIGAETRAFDERRLRLSVAPGIRHFLNSEGFVPVVRCTDREPRESCILLRGRPTAPRIFVDELPVPGSDAMDFLDTFRPRDFYQLDYITCPGGGAELHAYTYAYMTRMGRRPRIVLPACFP
jgi:hypothetical protein